MVEFANQMRRQNERYGFINYAADSSGFTLMDSFSYGEKHNLENGEDNRDGNPVNYSSNYGHRGRDVQSSDSQNPHAADEERPSRRFCSDRGVPMLLSGDETGNTQNGNNNAYCQDNRIGWLNVSRAKANRNLREFTRKMIAFRKAHPILSMEGAMQMKDYRHQGIPDLSYHGQEPWAMEVYREQRAIGMLYCGALQRQGRAGSLYLLQFSLSGCGDRAAEAEGEPAVADGHEHGPRDGGVEGCTARCTPRCWWRRGLRSAFSSRRRSTGKRLWKRKLRRKQSRRQRT